MRLRRLRGVGTAVGLPQRTPPFARKRKEKRGNKERANAGRASAPPDDAEVGASEEAAICRRDFQRPASASFAPLLDSNFPSQRCDRSLLCSRMERASPPLVHWARELRSKGGDRRLSESAAWQNLSFTFDERKKRLAALFSDLFLYLHLRLPPPPPHPPTSHLPALQGGKTQSHPKTQHPWGLRIQLSLLDSAF